MQLLLILRIINVIISILTYFLNIGLSSETRLHLPKGSVDKWDEIFCGISLSGSPEMGGGGYFCALWCADIWLADEICQETASRQEQVYIWRKKTQTWWELLEQQIEPIA